MDKLVSIITPVYNAEPYIETCISSVLAQTYEDWEMILVDDRSSDNSVSKIRKFVEKDQRVKLIVSQTNSGAGHARNLAIKASKGRYLAFLDSDDYWDSQKLEKQISFLTVGEYSIVYSQYYIFDQKTNSIASLVNSPKKVDFKSMQRNDYMGFLTLVMDTQKVGKPQMPTLRKRQDWAYKLLLLKNGFQAYGLQEPLAYYRVGNQSLSSNKFKLLKHNFGVFRSILNYSWLKSMYKMGIFLLFYFIFKSTAIKKVQ